MSSALVDYVLAHTERGDCKCGKCCDATGAPDPKGHTIDMVFFKVCSKDNPDIETFRRLSIAAKDGEFCSVDPFDFKEHNYMELGAWIGDQGIAMQYMALGVTLKAFSMLSPAMLGLDGPMAMQMAGAGLLAIQAKPVREEVPA